PRARAAGRPSRRARAQGPPGRARRRNAPERPAPALHRVHQPDQRDVPRVRDRRPPDRAGVGAGAAAPTRRRRRLSGMARMRWRSLTASLLALPPLLFAVPVLRAILGTLHQLVVTSHPYFG